MGIYKDQAYKQEQLLAEKMQGKTGTTETLLGVICK